MAVVTHTHTHTGDLPRIERGKMILSLSLTLTDCFCPVQELSQRSGKLGECPVLTRLPETR